MKLGDLVMVYLNNHDEPAPSRVYPGITREEVGTIVTIDHTTDDDGEVEVLVGGKLVWFYIDEIHPPENYF